MSEQEHKAPLQHEVGVEITQHPSRDYRAIAESVGTIINQRSALVASENRLANTERQLSVAHIDAITGLPDRSRYESNREAMISRARQSGRPLGMAILDGLGFKDINDTFGHETGDKALAHMAAKIKEAVRPTDIVYRIGGDEFAVLMPDYGVDSDLSEEELNKLVGRRIEESVQEGVDIIGFPQNAKVRVSAGVGKLRPGENGAEFYSRIDHEMFDHKEEQKASLRASGETLSR